MRVTKGPSGFLCSGCRAEVLIWSLGQYLRFLSRANRDLRVPFMFTWSQGLTPVELGGRSTLLPSQKSSARLLVGLTI